MPLLLSKEQQAEIASSLRRYFRDELDEVLSEMRAGFLLEYIYKEIGPLAYNQGIEDAQKYFRSAAQDLPGTCFEEPLTYWKVQAGGSVRRKPKS